jgi:hypothetical protein
MFAVSGTAFLLSARADSIEEISMTELPSDESLGYYRSSALGTQS